MSTWFSMNSIKRHAGLLFILPGLMGFVLFYLLPFMVSVWYSFMSRPAGGEFVGLSNYIDLLQSPAYRLGLRNTLVFMGLSVPLNMILSLVAAMLIKNTGRFKPHFVLIFLIPLVIPSGAMVFFWRMFFSSDGFLNNILSSLGFEGVNWLNSEYSMFTLLIIFVWKNLGFNLVLFLSGLSNVPKEYYEAAKTDGAGVLRTTISITLPCLMPITVIVLLMSIINSFKVFREVYLLMGAYPNHSVYMLQHFMNNNFFSLNYPRLTSATTLLSAAMAVITWGLIWLERKASHD
ncbi:MAG: sugar ABC transporter permease [Defluviitaleaceae bacterium]|nr:sugar ABC transporter permease [Defluviitaleaceae bacterium]